MEEVWTDRIRPKDRLFDINLKELWKYRDLMMMFVHRDIVTQYKQTILGPLWFLIRPAITVIMYMIVFGGIAGISTDGIPQPLFYLSGICFWQYFSDCLSSTSNTFVDNAGIFGKVYFPRLIKPLSTVISNMVRFSIQFLLFIMVYITYYLYTGCELTAHLNLYALLFPVLLLMLAGVSLGFGIIFSSMTTKYRDLQILLSFIIQLWMYATPIVYPLSQTRGKTLCGIDLDFIMSVNPVTPIIETFKYGFLSAGEFIGWTWFVYSLIFMFLLLFCGIIIFNRLQKSFMDTV